MDYNTYYHLYNHGNAFDDLFPSKSNYQFFLNSFHNFTKDCMDIKAFALLKNHFHFLIKTQSKEDIIKHLNDYYDINRHQLPKSFRMDRHLKKIENPQLHIKQRLSDTFNSYTQAFNKFNKRRGKLFLESYKLKRIDSLSYLKTIVCYIHNNPVKHGFSKSMETYQYTSFNDYKNGTSKIIELDDIYKTFGGVEEFLKYHKNYTS